MLFLLHSSLDNIGGNARQDTAFLPSVFSTVSVGIFSGCPLTSFLPFKWLKPPSPSKYKPLGQAEVGPALLFPQDCRFFFLSAFYSKCARPLGFSAVSGGHSWKIFMDFPAKDVPGRSLSHEANDCNAWIVMPTPGTSSQSFSWHSDFSPRARDISLPWCVPHHGLSAEHH